MNRIFIHADSIFSRSVLFKLDSILKFQSLRNLVIAALSIRLAPRTFLIRFILLCLTVTIVGCKIKDVSPASTDATVTAITVMTFNVENLFDHEDDPGKTDETYLPLSKKTSPQHKKKCLNVKVEKWRKQCLQWNWSEQTVQHKIKVVSDTIKQVNNGKGPDLLILQEVENLNILEQLNKKGELNYTTVVLLEGDDLRGIDVAMLSRFPLHKSAQLHNIEFSGFTKARVFDTRGILQADFLLPGGEVLTAFGVHFPAPFHPTPMRVQAFDKLNSVAKALPEGRLYLAAGDFNVTAEEDQKTQVTTEKTKGIWSVSHKVACTDCKGTNYYPPKRSWSFLDMILWSKTLNTGTWQVAPATVKIANKAPGQVDKKGFPQEYPIIGL